VPQAPTAQRTRNPEWSLLSDFTTEGNLKVGGRSFGPNITELKQFRLTSEFPDFAEEQQCDAKASLISSQLGQARQK